MAQRRIRTAAELQRRMSRGRSGVRGLSTAQVNRLVDGVPDRLTLTTLDALCDALQATPAELLTADVVGVPERVLETMLVDTAIATAHFQLCAPPLPGHGLHHPGDPFGRVLAWLWRSGHHHQAARLVADYLSEMREHNYHAPAAGTRLTWASLRRGIPVAIVPRDLPGDDAELEQMLTYLDEAVPGLYGASATELNTP